MVWCKGESFRNRNLLCWLSIPARENLEFDNFGCPRTWDDSRTRLFVCSIQQNPMAMTTMLKPLGIWEHDKIIVMEQTKLQPVERRTGLCFFHPSIQQSKKLLVERAHRFNEAHDYGESLVSVYLAKHQDTDCTNQTD